MRHLSTTTDTRVKIAGALGLLALLVIVGTLFYQQIFRHRFFAEQSENNSIRVQPVVPKRGLVFDRNMQVLSDNRLSFTVSLVPFERVENITVPKLARLLGIDSAEVEKRARANFVSRYMPTPIKRGLGIDTVSILEEQVQYYPGITYSAESVRRYPDSISAETFLGHVGEVSPDEIKSEKQNDYHLGSLIGKSGIEKSYDLLLRGLEGTKYIEVSAKGRPVGPYKGKQEIPAIPGTDLVLTIDKELQQFVVKNFDSVQCCGAVVAMNPKTGGVLALASFPHLDPNIFSGVIPSDIWQAIVSDTNHPLLNRPLAGLYPPASTSKLITAGAALEMGIVSEYSKLKPCFGGMQFGNRFFRCWAPAGHGKVDVHGSIEQSCDVYFYQIGQIMGVDAWGEYAEKCGFGRKSGIDLTGEKAGIVPSSEYYDNLYGPRKWSPYLILNLAIGQGEFTITPLQLAQFYCGLANDGKVYQPHLLKQVIEPSGEFHETKPILSLTLPFSQKTLKILRESLKLVIDGENGTARSLRNDAYKIAGKTGTAQNPHGDNHSWFSCFAPADDAEIVVVVLVENAGHGSEVAAPLAGKIMKYYLVDSRQQKIAGDLSVTE